MLLCCLPSLTPALLGLRVPDPAMPLLFSAEFDETTWHDNSTQIHRGRVYYDWTLGAQVIKRAVSVLNPICAEVQPGRTSPCTHHIHNGSRYLFWPDESDCCLHCDGRNESCGILKPTWPTAMSHWYSGRRVINGVDCHTWFVQSGTPDRIATSTGLGTDYPAGRLCELYDGGADFVDDNPFQWAIIPSSYQDTVEPTDVALPAVCKTTKKLC